jgi:hypothetical protein
MQASPKHLSALTPISEGMAKKKLPIRATLTFESEEIQNQVQKFTVDKMHNMRKQSEAINHLIKIGLKAEGYLIGAPN